MPAVRVDIRGSGESEGVLSDEYSPGRARRRRRGDRLAGAPAVVQRRGRHVRHLVGRLQRAAGRRAPAAGAEGDRHALLDRRPLRRRRALHGRRQAQRRLRLGELLLLRHDAIRPIPRWSASAGATMWLERLEELPLFLENWLRPPARATPTGSTARCARTTARSSARCWRSAAGPTATPTPSRACCEPRGAAPGPDRAVGARLSALRQARAADRLPAGDAAVVGPLAEGHRHRRRCASRCCGRG